MIILEFVPGPQLLLSTTAPARVLGHWNSFITLRPTSSRQLFTARQQSTTPWTLLGPASQTLIPCLHSLRTSPRMCIPHNRPAPASPIPPPQLLGSDRPRLQRTTCTQTEMCNFKKGAFLAFLSIQLFLKTGSLTPSASSPCMHPASCMPYCQAAKTLRKEVTEPWRLGRLKVPVI